jgi:hypothetical protein
MLGEIADDLVRQSAASGSGRSFSSSVIRAIR